MTMVAGREYVQPQWVFDSFNTGVMLPIGMYAPGKAPPAHLSPFVEASQDDYVPRQKELLDRLAKEAGVITDVAKATGTEVEVTALEQKTGYDRFKEELLAEAEGVG